MLVHPLPGECPWSRKVYMATVDVDPLAGTSFDLDFRSPKPVTGSIQGATGLLFPARPERRKWVLVGVFGLLTVQTSSVNYNLLRETYVSTDEGGPFAGPFVLPFAGESGINSMVPLWAPLPGRWDGKVTFQGVWLTSSSGDLTLFAAVRDVTAGCACG